MDRIELTITQFLELGQLAVGCFAPLHTFMSERDFISVVSRMRLASGDPFPLPVVLDVDEKTAKWARGQDTVPLSYRGEIVGHLEPGEPYTAVKEDVAQAVYGTSDPDHPGVRFFYGGQDWFIGGAVALSDTGRARLFSVDATPAETRRRFEERGWKKIVGFQTRNVPHRAHEYLQRTALEHVDGLFIQPLLGRKKAGDYTRAAILAGYRVMLDEFYPDGKVELGVLNTAMRYAGPREAVFHAIIRRNYGCTHFIVGRDHAGVGEYYGKYEAQQLALSFGEELGITIMPLHGPYHCQACDGLTTEQTCRHLVSAPERTVQISGTDVREALRNGRMPPPYVMRPEVFEALRDVPLFIEAEDE